MTKQTRLWVSMVVLLVATGVAGAADSSADANAPKTPEYPDKASASERKALDALAREVDGAITFARHNKIYVVGIGHWKPIELGSGQYARFSPDGDSLAVYDRGKVYQVRVADGERKLLAKDADSKDGCPVEFHPDGKDVLYWTKRDGFRGANVRTGKTRKLKLPAKYSGSAGLSADGNQMAVRWGHSLYAVDIPSGQHRKYARGCSPGVSPDGKWLMNNDGSHRSMTIRPWSGEGKKRKIDVRTCKPDRKWDNHHWSNHNDYIAAQGDGKQHEAYVVRVSENRCTRVSWMGKVGYPDVWIRPLTEADHEEEKNDDDGKAAGKKDSDGRE
ncbi:MAG: TolB family protein [Phycisphaerae bacterium]